MVFLIAIVDKFPLRKNCHQAGYSSREGGGDGVSSEELLPTILPSTKASGITPPHHYVGCGGSTLVVEVALQWRGPLRGDGGREEDEGARQIQKQLMIQ